MPDGIVGTHVYQPASSHHGLSEPEPPMNNDVLSPPVSFDDLIGHNTHGANVQIEARFFNSLAKYSGVDGVARKLGLPAGATVGDVIRMFALPLHDIYLVLRNGRDITPGLYQGGVINENVVLDEGDVIAFSGPVPYSYGYGAPVV